jgi:alkylation response protein AidB-like acyl-CoA dehydrogenase
MELELSDEQRALRDAARAFLEREAPISYARAMLEDERGWREDVWRRMAELGWTALPFPEEVGGIGQGFVALSILLAEMGRVVLPGPYFSTVVLAGHAILDAGSEAQRKEWLPRIAAGELTAAFAFEEDPPSYDEAAVRCAATPDGAGWRLRGEKRFVIDAASAERLVVAARAEDGVGLYLVARDDPAVAVAPVRTMDGTRRVAHVRLDGPAAERLGDGGWPAVRRVLDRACVALAAELLGAAERVLERSVAYAKERVQFGRPIGSFQAVKHRLADMAVEVESLRNAVAYAAWAVERDHPDAPLAASMAKAYGSDAARRITASGIQVHGGIGFTWEHDMHLYFKRAKASEAAFGSADWHRERIARLLERRYAGGPAEDGRPRAS